MRMEFPQFQTGLRNSDHRPAQRMPCWPVEWLVPAIWEVGEERVARAIVDASIHVRRSRVAPSRHDQSHVRVEVPELVQAEKVTISLGSFLVGQIVGTSYLPMGLVVSKVHVVDSRFTS